MDRAHLSTFALAKVAKMSAKMNRMHSSEHDRAKATTLSTHELVADGLVGIAYVFTGAKRTIRLALHVDELMTLPQCCAEMFLADFRL